jgi:hypothetical protein
VVVRWRPWDGGSGGSSAAAAASSAWQQQAWLRKPPPLPCCHRVPPWCNKDTGGNSNGEGTYNNQQLTKRSGSNGNGNGNNDSNNGDNGNKGNVASSSLARAQRWSWWQHGSEKAGTYNNQQLTKRSGGNGAGNNDDISDTMTMKTKAMAVVAAWREHGVRGGGSVAVE